MQERKEITPEVIKTFIDGRDPKERIVNIDYSYNSKYINVYYRDKNDKKCVSQEPFYPFVWAKRSACVKMCNGDRKYLRKLMNEYGINVKALDTRNNQGEICEEIDKDGYTFLFYAMSPMPYQTFRSFFSRVGTPLSPKKSKKGKSYTDVSTAKVDDKLFLCVSPQEQHLIRTGERFFKGYNDYDETLRMIFDLETTGLNTKTDRIEQFGIRFNRPFMHEGKTITFEKIFTVTGDTEEEKNASELDCILKSIQIIYTFEPDIITAHNGETFDWNMIIGACERLGTSLEELSAPYFNGKGIVKSSQESILKLGGEIETYFPTIVPGVIVTDSLHAVRRAQALDSNMLRADLKYVTKYSKIVKKDRVYVPGDNISTIWNDLEKNYAFCDADGDWYQYDTTIISSADDFKKGKDNDKFVLYKRNYIADGYHLVSGRYIVERYLLDDLWECDKVEHRYNLPNFLICKMLPVPFQRCCTMGTAGQWKSLLLAWSYENNLAIPPFGESKKFTGGLSRLLKVGFVDNVIKLDYNSLYPSIILTWAISDKKDLMDSMLSFLEHVLTEREKYKKLKKKAGKRKEQLKEEIANFQGSEEELDKLKEEMAQAAQEESQNDKLQLPMKILGNSFFGSFGAPDVFPWGSLDCAERTTCTGRQSLRLMIYHFSNIDKFARLGNQPEYNYTPIVGDSFSGDTPMFIKYKDSGYIDIKPISEMINENEIHIDVLNREYDYSKKEYYVLSRSGWVEPTYIYRHKTSKNIYKVTDKETEIDVTEDHSLFNDMQQKIKPSEINKTTKLEYYTNEIIGDKVNNLSEEYIDKLAAMYKTWHIISKDILNCTSDNCKTFLEKVEYKNYKKNKTEEAKFLYILNKTK